MAKMKNKHETMAKTVSKSQILIKQAQEKEQRIFRRNIRQLSF